MRPAPWDGRCTKCKRSRPEVNFAPKHRSCYSCQRKARGGRADAWRGKTEQRRPDGQKPAANQPPLDPVDAIPIDVEEPADEYVDRLVTLTRGKEPMEFEALCDALDLSPSRTREVIEAAREQCIGVRVDNGRVGIAVPVEDSRTVDVDIKPVVGQRQKIAVISDIHFGSKYCLRQQVKDFVDYAYDQGVRDFLHPGDFVDGCYKFAQFEWSHVGLDDQTDDAFESLPHKPGARYHCITGNHDWTYTEKTGVDVGQYVMSKFGRLGRNDVSFYGNRGAFLKLRGAVFHLWHPSGGGSYARSYKLQKRIEAYSSGEKPHVLLTGHFHYFNYGYERGVDAFACPTFQGGGSAFGKSLSTGAPAIGGLIISWDVTADGTIRDLLLERRFYFEREQPHRIDDRDGGIAVERSAAHG